MSLYSFGPPFRFNGQQVRELLEGCQIYKLFQAAAPAKKKERTGSGTAISIILRKYSLGTVFDGIRNRLKKYTIEKSWAYLHSIATNRESELRP